MIERAEQDTEQSVDQNEGVARPVMSPQEVSPPFIKHAFKSDRAYAGLPNSLDGLTHSAAAPVRAGGVGPKARESCCMLDNHLYWAYCVRWRVADRNCYERSIINSLDPSQIHTPAK